MFILRIIINQNYEPLCEYLQTNQIIGDSYNLIEKAFNPKEFETLADIHFGKDQSDTHRTSTYAFVVYKDGSSVRPLYKNQDAYIMTSDGKTFNHIIDHTDNK